MKTTIYTTEEIRIMTAALPIIEAVPVAQDECWPGDGPAHDDHCALSDHELATAAVQATEGLIWEFSSWSRTADWLRSTIQENTAVGTDSTDGSNEYRKLIHRLIAGKKALMEMWGKRVGSALNAYDAEIRAAWDRGEEQGNMKAETKAKLAALMQSRDDAEEQYNRKETEFYRQVDRWLAEIIYNRNQMAAEKRAELIGKLRATDNTAAQQAADILGRDDSIVEIR